VVITTSTDRSTSMSRGLSRHGAAAVDCYFGGLLAEWCPRALRQLHLSRSATTYGPFLFVTYVAALDLLAWA